METIWFIIDGKEWEFLVRIVAILYTVSILLMEVA